VANLDGMTRCGLWLIEFGIPLPSNFLINVIPNPIANTTGSPFSRASISFPDCERGADEHIILYTLEGIVTSPVDDVALTVGAGMPPSSGIMPYPWAGICPLVTMRRRLGSNTFFVNPSMSHDCDRPVSVTRRTWTAMKALYRD
jgi:hypothetical protein